jgi:FkbH-like protein
MAQEGGGLLRRLWGGARPSAAPEPAGSSAFEGLFGAPGGPKPKPAVPPGLFAPAPRPEPALPSGPPPEQWVVEEAPPAPSPPPAAPQAAQPAKKPPKMVEPVDYLTPLDLGGRAGAPPPAVLIGAGFLHTMFLPRYKALENLTHDFILVTNITDFPATPPRPIDEYDFQFIQIPLSSVIPTRGMHTLAFDDIAGFQEAFDQSCELLALHLERRMIWNIKHGLLSFVASFMQPQFPSTGLLLPRYDLRNIEYFVACLNQELERLLAGYSNCHLLDMDRLSASFGRRYVQDDVFVSQFHNSQLLPHYRIGGRIEDLWPVGFHYEMRPGAAFRDAVLGHLRALYRAARQQDSIKLVVTDLDDTLWQGVMADIDEPGPRLVEGWPLGYIEALQILRRRGILLGIISKNDDGRVREVWDRIMREMIRLDDFADIRINWLPKSENMRAMLAAMNLLPRHVVFVDDNPAERAQMQAAFPDMQVIGDNPFKTRRILLLAAETQVASVSEESAARTQMVQAQIKRENDRAGLSFEEFARQQQVTARLDWLAGVTDKRFERALELINKTNQFNTTGKRWKAEELGALLAQGGRLAVLRVTDRYTEYGLTGVVIVHGGVILQWVMSCRVLGMGVERSGLRAVVDALRAAGEGAIAAKLIKTEVNKPCQGFYAMAGFEEERDAWWLPAEMLPEAAPYVTLTVGPVP